jgi:hypothetical protein
MRRLFVISSLLLLGGCSGCGLTYQTRSVEQSEAASFDRSLQFMCTKNQEKKNGKARFKST